ncbi:MAG: hypothetical protein LBD80_05380, partial [Tannerella sp.]|nr:hypothetical protein [Tannerella sp.]
MKLTTKIVTGIILSIFILSLAFITGFSFTDRKNYRRTNVSVINIPRDSKTGIDTEPYRTIVLERDKYEQERIYHYIAEENCGLFLNPVTAEAEKNKLFIPDALLDFISVKTCNDTLTVNPTWHGYSRNQLSIRNIHCIHFTYGGLQIFHDLQLSDI